jgi:hypothetical protein
VQHVFERHLVGIAAADRLGERRQLGTQRIETGMLENLVGRRLGPLFAGAPPRRVNNMLDILHEARSAPNRTLRPQARIRIRLDNEDATLIVHPESLTQNHIHIFRALRGGARAGGRWR